MKKLTDMSQDPIVDELKARRKDILNLFNQAETEFMRRHLNSKIKSVNRHLFTITKNPIYL